MGQEDIRVTTDMDNLCKDSGARGRGQEIDHPLVSIVVPSYNRAVMLPRAVKACLAQTFGNIEVIVVNDGSNDNTSDVCRQLVDSDPRVRVFDKSNGGVASALNYGFKRARGVYVTWSSDDNVYYPQAIEKLVYVLAEKNSVGFVYSDVQEVDEQGKPVRIVHSGEPEELRRTCVIQACFLYRRDVMDAVGEYDSRWTRCQDYDYYLRINKKYMMYHLREVLYEYTAHEASMSGNHEAHVLEEATLLAHHADSHEEKRRIWLARLGYLGRHCENRGRHWKASWYYLRSIPYDRKRTLDFVRSSTNGMYNEFPVPVKQVWRGVKKNLKLMP
jgi:glycosyltransferase involved in cell wall biosynthesis